MDTFILNTILAPSLHLMNKNNYGKTALPVTTAKDNIKCLDFDIERTTFRSAEIKTSKPDKIHPYKKTMEEVMDMV